MFLFITNNFLHFNVCQNSFVIKSYDFTESLLEGMSEMSIGNKQNEQTNNSIPITTNQTARVVSSIKTAPPRIEVRISFVQIYFILVDSTKLQKYFIKKLFF